MSENKVRRLGEVLEYLIPVGALILVVLATLVYTPYFTDYMIPKTAALHAMIGLLLGIGLIQVAVQGGFWQEGSPLYLPLAVYLAISLLSLLGAHNRAQGAEVWLTQVWLFVLYLLVCRHFRSSVLVLVALWTVAFTGLVVAGLGVLQYSGIHLIPLPKAYGNLPVSTLGNTNFVAHYLDLIIPLTSGMLIARRRVWERLALGVILAVTSFHMVLTQNRGGWVALSATLLFVLLGWRRRFPWHRVLFLSIVVAALLSPVARLVLDSVPLGARETLYDRALQIAGKTWDRALSVFEGSDFTISQRRLIWRDTLELSSDHLWLGVGPGNYELFLPAYRSATRHREWKSLMGKRTEVAYQAHNDYLEILAENGLFGLAAFLWLMGALLWQGRCLAVSNPDPGARAMTVGCLAGLVATLVHCAFSFNLQDPTSAVHFWLLAGLMVAINSKVDRSRSLFRERRLGRIWRWGLGVAAAAAIALGSWLGLCILMGDYYYFQGLWHHELGYPNRATLAFERAIAWRGFDFRYHHMLGLSHLKGERYAQAEQALRRSLELHPNNALALRLLGRAIYQEGGKGGEAIKALRQAARLAPLEPETYTWLALAYRQQRQHDQAIEAWKQALAFEPESAVLLNELGEEYLRRGQSEEAIFVLEQAARLHPSDGQIQGTLGSAYLSDGRLAEAEQALRQAIELNPGQIEWRLNLAQLYQRQQRFDLALAQVQQVLEQAPDNLAAQQVMLSLHQSLPRRER